MPALNSIAKRPGAIRDVGRHGADAAERVLILGTGPLARAIGDEVVRSPGHRYSVVGIVGKLPDLSRVLDRFPLDRIVVALDERGSQLPVLDLVDARSRGIAVEDGRR